MSRLAGETACPTPMIHEPAGHGGTGIQPVSAFFSTLLGDVRKLLTEGSLLEECGLLISRFSLCKFVAQRRAAQRNSPHIRSSRKMALAWMQL
jgi:hypothetical protein